MPLILDIESLTPVQTDGALEFIYKALSEEQLVEAIFDQHPSPFIRHLVELFYERGLLRLTDLRDELETWLEGKHHGAGPVPQRPDGAMLRWTPAELQLVRIYLSAIPPADYVLDDYMLLIDFLFQRYLPANDLRTEADWLATRGSLMGRVQANIEKLTERQADKVLAALPTTPSDTERTFDMTKIQAETMRYAASHAGENVVEFSDKARRKLRRLVLQVEAECVGQPGLVASKLQAKLGVAMGELNRDWRMIAVTEAGESFNQGVIASLKPGTKVKRIEQYRGACAFCRKIDGKVYEVVSPDAPNKDGNTMVWVGKTNIGRSAAPRKRVGTDLVEREPEERWWPAAGTQHPHCRGVWLPTAGAVSDPDMQQFLNTTLGERNAA